MVGFRPISVIFCDYVTQDIGGKNIHVGISQEELRLPGPPPLLAPIFIVATIKPLSNDFKYVVDFDAPDGSRIVRLNASCKIDGYFSPRHSIATNLQTPAIPFPGEGEYTVRIRDEHLNVVHTQPLYITIGVTQAQNINFEGSVEVGEKYAPSVIKH